MPSYLQRRRRRWYAVMEIPKKLRPRFGKARFVRSLGTESRTMSENVVADIVGHEKTTMTYGLSSGGVSLAVKREALDKLAYARRQLKSGNYGTAHCP